MESRSHLEPESGKVYQMKEEKPMLGYRIYDTIKPFGKRILDFIRNSVLLILLLPIINLIICFVYIDWCLNGRTYQKVLNMIDDYLDTKINDIVSVVQENEQFIVLTPNAEEEDDEEL